MLRLNMPPLLSVNNSLYLHDAYSVNLGDFRVRHLSRDVHFPYLHNIFGAEFCPAVIISWMWIVKKCSALALHIVSVLLWSASTKMARIAASRISYTGMQNERLFFRYNSFVESHPRSPVSILLSGFWKIRPAVAPNAGAGPRPALVWCGNFNLLPEPRLEIVRQYLLEKCPRCKIFAHSVSMLIVCHALGCLQRNARAL